MANEILLKLPETGILAMRKVCYCSEIILM